MAQILQQNAAKAAKLSKMDMDDYKLLQTGAK